MGYINFRSAFPETRTARLVPGIRASQGPNADSAFTSAIRVNADLKAPYEQLIKAGKAPEQVITALMRKLLILANALLKKGRKRQPRVA